jgi:cytochrome b561
MEDRNIRSAGAEEATYSTAARRFHWWTVLLIAVQVAIGLFMVRYGAATNFAEPTGKLYYAHKLIGLTILLLALVRLAYRLAHGAPADERPLARWETVAGHAAPCASPALVPTVPRRGRPAISYYGLLSCSVPLPSLVARWTTPRRRRCSSRMLAAYALIVRWHACGRGADALRHQEGWRAAAHVGACRSAVVTGFVCAAA